MMLAGSVPKAKLLIQPPQKQIVYVEAPMAVPRIVERVVEKVVPQTVMMQVVGERVVDDKLMYQTLNTQVRASSVMFCYSRPFKFFLGNPSTKDCLLHSFSTVTALQTSNGGDVIA